MLPPAASTAPKFSPAYGIAGGAALAVEAGARLLTFARGFYAVSLMPPNPADGTAGEGGLAAVNICAAPDAAELDLVDLSGRPNAWLTQAQRLFATVPPGGTVALLTAYRGSASQVEAIAIEVRRLDRGEGEPDRLLVLGLPPEQAALNCGAEAVAFLRDGGEVRFVDTDWIGCRGRWLEAFTLLPRGNPPPAALEYKALAAGGEETAWTAGGATCGTPAGKAPLLGFAMRQRPASGPPLFDCEYSGYFQSGAIVGPARNGAPCLSPSPNDPLEGLRVRLVPRPQPAPA